MAMLAEPRRKQKWTLNPRGKHWSEDSNKFGQRMLEKMGWTAGKGLGANEQGMTEHVRVSFKNDTGGVGFKMEDLDKAWTEYQEGFNELLQELQKCQNSGSDDIVEVKCEPSDKKSLELKSKQSRARVHYQKFTRGKDINRYSSKDLANIFGQKELNVEGKAKEVEIEEVYVNDPVGTKDKTAGVVTINSGSMADYFKKMGSTLYRPSEYPKDNQSGESDCEITYTGFGFASAETAKSGEVEKSKEIACFENPCLNLDTSGETKGTNDTAKVSKKRKQDCGLDSDYRLNNQAKKLKEDVTITNSTNGFVNVALNLETASTEVCNGKEFEVSRAEFGLTNCALDLTDEVKETRRVTFNDHVEYSDDCMKKKKKKKTTLDKFEVENKKHKRKRKQENSQSVAVPAGFVNEALDVQEVAEEINDNEVNERKSKKAKKRKDRRSNLETIPEAPDEEKEVREEQPPNIDVTLAEDSTKDTNADETLDENLSKKEKKKKKKKKEKSKEENNVEDTEINVSMEETQNVKAVDEEQSMGGTMDEAQEENSKEHKKNKKKKKDKHKSAKNSTESVEVGQEEATFDVESTVPNTISDPAEESSIERQDKFRLSIRKKKKKKDKDNHVSADAVCDNAAFNVQETVSEEKMECEPLEERQESGKEAVEQSSIKKEKKKKKKKKDIEIIETDSNTKEEVSDKENTKVDKEEQQIKKSKKKKGNKKESSGVDANTCNGSEAEKRDSDSEKTSQNANISETTPSKRNDDNNEISKFISSPWNEKAKMSKKLLKSLFHRNAISNFPGSNIHDIKGYGVDVQ